MTQAPPPPAPARAGPTRVVICGSQYGVMYADAVLGMKEVQLVGLLARGSPRSQWIAEQCGVPLHRSPGEVPEGVQLACVAVGGPAGEEIGTRFLERGVHVLQEHPVSAAFVRDATRLAASRGCGFHVNGHFSDLPAARTFIDQVREARARHAPLLGSVLGSERALYSILDILAQALGPLEARTNSAVSTHGNLATTSAVLADLPFSIGLQRSGDIDDGRDTVVGHRISVVFPDGDILLTSAFGPVIASGMLGARSEQARTWKQVGPRAERHSQLTELRVRANRVAIRRLLRQVESGQVEESQTAERWLDVSTSWAVLGTS